MIRSYKDLAFRYMGSQKKRTVLNVLAVAMSAALLAGSGTIIKSMEAQMIRSAILKQGNYHVAFNNVTASQAHIIENHMDVEESCSGRIEGFAVLAETGNGDVPFRLLRIGQYDRKGLEMMQFESFLVEGRLPERDEEIAVDQKTMKTLGSDISLGSVVDLPYGQRRKVSDQSIISHYIYPLTLVEGEEESVEYFEEVERRRYTITGVLREELSQSDNYSSNGLILGNPSQTSNERTYNVLVLLKNPGGADQTAKKIAGAVGLDQDNIAYNTRLLNVSGHSMNRGVRESMSGFLGIINGIIVIATVAVIFNSFNIALIERISQLGILRCVGSTPSQIRKLIYREAFYICLMAIPPGIASGLAAMKIVFAIADALSQTFLFEDIAVVLSPSVILSSLIICGGSVFLAVSVSAVKAGIIPPVEAVRSTGLYNHDRFKRRTTSSTNRALSLSFTPFLAGRNMIRNRKRFAVTLFSMVISVVLFVSFGGMLRLARSSYIFNPGGIPGILLKSVKEDFSEDILDDLSHLPGVDLLITYGSEETSFIIGEQQLTGHYKKYVDEIDNFDRDGDRVVLPHCRILTYGEAAMEEMISLYGLEEDTESFLVGMSRFNDDQGTIAYAPGVTAMPGESLLVRSERGESVMAVGGVSDDVFFKNFNEKEGGLDLVLSPAEFFRLTGRSGWREIYIRMIPGADKTALIGYMEGVVNRKIGYSYVDASAQAEDLSREFQAISLFFYGFIAVIALIGSLNIINTISTNILVRSREFGIIRAVGLDMGGIHRLVLTESLIYCAVSLLAGSLLGSYVWYLLVRNMSQIRITVYSIPWREIGIAAAGLGIILLLSGYFPMKRIRDRSIVDNIRMEE